MKLDIQRDSLVAALGRAATVVPVKPTLPIVGCCLLTAEGDKLTVRTTDLNMTLTDRLDCTVKTAGAAALGCKQFAALVGALPPGPIAISVAKGVATLTAGKRKLTLRTLDAEDFPNPAEPLDAVTATLPAGSLVTLIGTVLHAAAIDTDRPNLHGVQLMAEGDKLKSAASDGKRCAILSLPGGEPRDAFKALVPVRAARALLALAEAAGDKPVELTFSGSRGSAVAPRATLEFSLPNDPPPGIEYVIAGCDAYPNTCIVDSEALAAAFQCVATAGDEGRGSTVEIHWEKGKIRLTLEGDRASGVDEVDCGTSGEHTALVPASMMVEALKAVPGTVTIRGDGELDPVYMTAGAAEYRAVVMPMRRFDVTSKGSREAAE